MEIAKEIRNIRKKLGKTQKEIGLLLGIPSTTWASYEAGKANPPLKVLMKLAEMGYEIKGLTKNNIVIGDNNTQTIGENNTILINSESNDEYSEIFKLIKNYATPKMLKELKETLLKIKEAVDG